MPTINYEPQMLTTTLGTSGTAGAVDLKGYSIIAIMTPATLTTTTLNFLAGTSIGGADGTALVGNTGTVYDSAGNKLAVTVGVSQVVTDIPELGPIRYLQLAGTTTEAAVRTLLFLVK